MQNNYHKFKIDTYFVPFIGNYNQDLEREKRRQLMPIKKNAVKSFKLKRIIRKEREIPSINEKN